MMLVGGYIFVTLNKKYPKSIGLLLGLSGGFLLGIIFFGIIPEAHEILEEAFDTPLWVMAAALTGGALFIILFEKMIDQKISYNKVIIEENVWIGTKATILNGVIVGNGSIIGAHSLVNRNIEPGLIVGGIPVKVLKKREQE